MLRLFATGALSAFALAGLAAPAAAQFVTVDPVVINMQPGQLTATMSISGQVGADTSYQVRAFSWSQNDNADRLDPTEDVLLSPPVGTVPANSTQVVRIVIRRPPKDHESVYRILLDQIPPPSAPGTVRVAIRLSMPIFVEPTVRVAPHIDWHVERDADSIFLVATNTGKKHLRIRDIAVTAGTSTLRPQADSSPYLLAGSTRRLPISGDGVEPAPDAIFRLTAKSDGGRIDVTVPTSQKL
jgi:fimbrial chaperone protein